MSLSKAAVDREWRKARKNLSALVTEDASFFSLKEDVGGFGGNGKNGCEDTQRDDEDEDRDRKRLRRSLFLYLRYVEISRTFDACDASCVHPQK